STGSPTSTAYVRAFYSADRSVLSMLSAALFFDIWSKAYASPTLRPRMRSMTSRILRGLCRTYLLIARASMIRLLGLGPLVRELAAVPPEEPRRRELAQLVPDHVLRDVHGNELVAVVHRERVPDEVRGHRRRARPGLDDPLLAPAVHLPDLLEQLRVDVRSLSYGSSHSLATRSGAHFVALPRRRPRTMYLFDRFFRLRVFLPSGSPHGDTGGRPPDVLPSPPPSGWSIGFIATPRTRGRRPRHRFAPALPMLRSSCSTFPTCPIVARHSLRTMRTSVDGRRSVTKSPSFATTCAPAPAERTICAPLPGFSSTLCTTVPSGISPSGSALPVRMSEPGPLTTVSPWRTPTGCRLSRFSASS